MYKTPVSATSLAACIKVDSCCISKRIPRLLCAFHIGSFEIALENHFHASENGMASVRHVKNVARPSILAA